jgi:hypothetical protein
MVHEMKRQYSSKSNLIAQLVEATNAQLGVTKVIVLGKAEAAMMLA